MIDMKKILEKVQKHLLLTVFVLVTTSSAVYTITKAVDEGSSSDSSESSDSAEKKLTTEEIDKIIEDLKVSGNIDNILDKLDEIIARAKLSGNEALQEYATNMKQAYELQKQLDSVKSLIEASKKKNSDIAAVDEQVSKIISLTVEDLRGAVSDEALLVLESLGEDDLKKLQDLFAEVNDLVDLNDVGSLTVQQRALLDILILTKIIDDEMVKDEKLETVKSSRYSMNKVESALQRTTDTKALVIGVGTLPRTAEMFNELFPGAPSWSPTPIRGASPAARGTASSPMRGSGRTNRTCSPIRNSTPNGRSSRSWTVCWLRPMPFPWPSVRA